MIKTQLLQSSHKQILAKPQTIKIQHKSYKELLGLGRPKKRVLVESDDDNDDFLEKLLREQQKQKKKKKQVIKRNISKNSKISVPRKQKQSNDDKHSHEGRKQNQEASEKSNDLLKYESQQHKSIEQQKQFQRNDEAQESPKIHIAKRQKQILRNYSAAEKKFQNNPNTVIKIDELDENPYIITQNIIRNASHTGIIRSSKGFKVLQEVRKGQTARNFSINPKLNIETKQIIHSFNNQVQYPPFKAKVLSLEEILSMCQTRVPVKKKVVPKRERMFKNPEEDEQLSKYIRSLSQKSSKYL